MKDLGITPGAWEISPDNNWECCILLGDQEDHYINLENRNIDGWDQMHANAELICDAGNTAQSCGLLPSELLKQRDELLKAISILLHLHYCEQEGIGSGQPTPEQWYTAVDYATEVVQKVEAAIKSTEQ